MDTVDDTSSGSKEHDALGTLRFCISSKLSQHTHTTDHTCTYLPCLLRSSLQLPHQFSLLRHDQQINATNVTCLQLSQIVFALHIRCGVRQQPQQHPALRPTNTSTPSKRTTSFASIRVHIQLCVVSHLDSTPKAQQSKAISYKNQQPPTLSMKF